MVEPKNVLFIVIDQWRAEALGCMGNPVLKTPNLDRLAQDGMLFTQHYSQAAPCGPARASLLTGMYQHNTGVFRNGTPLDSRFTNLALEARKAGHDPILFGYTDTTLDPRRHHAGDPAMRTYESVLPGFTPRLHLPEQALEWLSYLREKGYDFPVDMDAAYRPEALVEGQGPTFAPARFAAEHSITAYLTDEAMKYISVRRDMPWFVHLAYIRPHPPFIAPSPYHAMYAAEDMPAPRRASSAADEARQHPVLDYYIRTSRLSEFVVDGKGLACELGERDLAQLRATYYGMVSEVDHQVGRLIEQLKAWDLYDRTLIVITSDHGEMLGDHWMLGKNGYCDEAFHIPLIVRVPGDEAAAAYGQRRSEFTEAIDIMPTILEWLGLPAPRQCDGRSLLDFTRGRTPASWRTEVHWEFDIRAGRVPNAGPVLGVHPDRSSIMVIRDTKHKYVHFADLPPLFFDLETDADCLHDLASAPARSDAMLRYAQKMLSWRIATNARELAHLIALPQGMTSILD